MAASIPENFQDLLHKTIVCALSTVSPNGQPHTVPVWFDFDGTNIRVNAPAATQKAKNMSQGTKVSVLVVDTAQSNHYVEVRGHIAEVRDESQGAREHINSLSARYLGNPVYPGFGNSNLNRIMYVIEPDKVTGQ